MIIDCKNTLSNTILYTLTFDVKKEENVAEKDGQHE